MTEKEILSEMRMAERKILPATLFESRLDVNPLIIKEGLICSYPMESVICSIAQLFKLEVGGSPSGVFMDYNGRIMQAIANPETDFIKVILKKSAADKKTSMDNHFLKYGWYNSRIDDNDGYLILWYERKFGDRFTARQLRNITQYIYHITSIRLKKKIQKEGLIPKASKSIGFEYNERIFFNLEKPSRGEAQEFQAMKLDGSLPIVLEVNLEKLSPQQAFFFDARWMNSIYTFEPIPPTAIKSMDISELPNFKLNPLKF